MIRASQPFEQDHFRRHDHGAGALQPSQRGFFALGPARTHGVGDHQDRTPPFQQSRHGLQYADMGLEAGDDDRAVFKLILWLCGAAQTSKHILADGGRSEFGQFCNGRPQLFGILLGDQNFGAEQPRAFRKTPRIGDGGFGPVDRRGQPGLKIDQQQQGGLRLWG